MSWSSIAIESFMGLALIASPRLFFNSDGDAGRDARMSRGLSTAGAALLHLAALSGLLKSVAGQ